MEFLGESSQQRATHGFAKFQCSAMRSVGFANAARKWVPKEELLVIELTQEGRIHEGFSQAARIASVRSKLMSTLLGGLAYPCALLFIGGTVISILPQYALELMGGVLNPDQWPSRSKSVLAFANFLQEWGIPAVISLFSFIALGIYSAPRWTGSLRSHLEWLPPFIIYRQFAAPEVLVAWLALMRAGIQRLRALDQLEKGLPAYLASHVRAMRSRIYSGASLDSALDTGLFSVETLEDLRIYDRIGKFSDRSETIAAEDVDRALANLEKMTRMLSTFLLLVIAGIAIWIYTGIAAVTYPLQHSEF